MINVSNAKAADSGEPHQAANSASGWRRSVLPAVCILAGCCLLFITLEVSSQRTKSVTVDEFGHLAVGLNLLTTGDMRYASLNPPLMNALSALPLHLAGARVTPPPELSPALRQNFWANGYAFMNQRRDTYHDDFVRARYVTIGIVALLGLVVFAWGRLLAPACPNTAGLLAANLVWFSPEVLAHGQLVTTDAGLAAFMVFALFTLYLFLRRASWPRALATGVTLGLAQLVKFSAIFLFPAHAILLLVIVWREPQLRTRRFLLQAVAVFVVAGFVINAGYGFAQSGRPAGALAFKSRPFQALAQSWAGRLPIPLPAQFLIAFDQQSADALEIEHSFLFGRFYEGGRWYYFLALLAIKTPLPVLVLTALALFCALRKRGLPRRDTLLLLLPGALVFVALSAFSQKQIGLRMILPSLVLGLVWAAATLARAGRSPALRSAIGVLLVWLAVDLARVHPDYLAYFNQFVGGPANGYRFAGDSNLDWGQDLPALRDYMQQQKLERIQLLYYGRVDPAVYGIDYSVPFQSLEPGCLAISRSLYSFGYHLNDHGAIRWGGPFEVPAIPGFRRVATLGHTIDIYRISSPQGMLTAPLSSGVLKPSP